MTLPVGNQVYTQGTGTASTNVFITFFATRNPTANDYQFPISKRWINTNTAKEFILANLTTVGGQTQANWINLTNGSSSGLDELTGNAGGPGMNPVLPDNSGNINIYGDGTSINVTGNAPSHTLTASVILPSTANEVLISGSGNSIAAVPNGTAGQVLTSNGTSAPTWQAGGGGSSLTMGPFGSTPNANAGVIATNVLTLEPADATHPGGLSNAAQTLGSGVKTFTDSPIIPLTGVLTGNGATALTASVVAQNNVVLGDAANGLTTIGNGTSGWVLTSNGASAPSFQSLPASTGIQTIDGTTGSVTGATVTFSGGTTGITFTGASTTMTLGGDLVVANGGTGVATFPVNGVVTTGTTGTAALSAQTLTDGQLVIGATGASPAAGSIIGGTGITVTPAAHSITISSTATGMVWTAQSTSFTAVAGHGYLCNVSITATLPQASVGIGQTISFVAVQAGGTGLTITCNPSSSDSIEVGAYTSSAPPGAAKCVSTNLADSITLVSNGVGKWYSVGAPQGVWILS